MSAHILRQAAALMREEHGPDHPRHEMWSAMAAWLDMTAGQVTSYGPNADSPWISPHVQMALSVANTYLGAPR